MEESCPSSQDADCWIADMYGYGYYTRPDLPPRCGSVQGFAHIICSLELAKRPSTNSHHEGTNLSLTVCPKVHAQSNHLINSSVRPLVDERGSQGGKREDGQAGLETAVKAGSGDETKRPLPSDEQESEYEVDDLQNRYRLDGGV